MNKHEQVIMRAVKAKAEKAIERIVAFGQEFRQTNENINFYREHYGLTLISTGVVKEPSIEDQARKFALINRAMKVQLWDDKNKPYELVNRKVVWR